MGRCCWWSLSPSKVAGAAFYFPSFPLSHSKTASFSILQSLPTFIAFNDPALIALMTVWSLIFKKSASSRVVKISGSLSIPTFAITSPYFLSNTIIIYQLLSTFTLSCCRICLFAYGQCNSATNKRFKKVMATRFRVVQIETPFLFRHEYPSM